jgi:ferredoxin/flavodoxin
MFVPIVYFSSSNNTAYIARIIAKGLESQGIMPELVKVEDVRAGRYDLSQSAVLGVGAPIYGGFAEPVMYWAKSFDFSGKRVFLFSTAGIFHFGSTKEMIRLVEGGGGKVIGALEVTFRGAMDGIFFMRWQAERNPIRKADLERSLQFGHDIGSIALTGEGYADSTYHHRLGGLTLRIIKAVKDVVLPLVKRAFFEETCGLCVNCAACEKVCPVDAIRAKGECVEIDRDKCIACFRCFKACPKGALSLRFADKLEYYRGPWQLKGYVKPEELAREQPSSGQ